VQALHDADGITESKSEPAAIDEILNAALFERPAPKATTAETVAADLASLPRDIPIPLNSKVLSYVELYQGRLREFMQGGLDRAQAYLPMIRAIFEEEGVPLDLAFVPLIESAFKPNALSRVSARGMWQFMLPTAKEHGLKRISMAALYAASRFNAHVYLTNAGSEAGKDRPAFLDYMTKLYRQMLNEHLDGLGHERGMDVGESELKAEIAALQAAREAQGKPAA